jgi:O-antigen ligase
MTRLYWFSGFLLLLSWLLPLHVPPWVSWHSEMAAAAALLLPCLAVAWAPRGLGTRATILVPTSALLPVVIAAVALVQTLEGTIAYWGSFWTILFYAALTVAAACAGYADASASQDPPRRATFSQDAQGGALVVLAQMLLVASLAQIFIVFTQTFQIWDSNEWIARTGYLTRGSGNVAQPNQAALVFVMGAASASYLSQRQRLGLGVSLLLMGTFALGVSVTGSRAGALAFCGLVGWWMLFATRLRGLRWSASVSLGLVAWLAVTFLSWPFVIARYLYLDGSVDISVTSSGRTEMWRQFLHAAGLHPWAGWGVLQVAKAQTAIADAYPSVMSSTFSHNVLLDVALWAGIPAAGAFAVACIAWVVRRVQSVRSADSPEAWYCVALLMLLAIQSMTEFPYAYAYFLFPVFFALGALDATLGLRRGFALDLWWVRAFLVAAVAVGAWSVAEYIDIEEDFRVARFEALNVGKVPVAYEAPKVVLLTQLGALLNATRTDPKPGMLPADIEMLKNVSQLYPWAPTKFRYLTALALNGQMDEARRQLQIVRVMHGRDAYVAVQQRLIEMADSYPVLKELAAP